MKTRKYVAGLTAVVASSLLFTSCVQKNYYNANPNSNNNNGTTGGYTNTFDEEFNGGDSYGWTFTDVPDSAYATINSGNYQYIDYSTTLSNMSVVNTGANTTGNFTAKTSIKSNNQMGLIFGASATDNGYAFYMDSTGSYSLYKEGTGTAASTAIIAPTSDSTYAVKKGWNTLEVDQVNGIWTFYINGTQTFQMAARSISGSRFGYKVLPGTTGYADYLQVQSN